MRLKYMFTDKKTVSANEFKRNSEINLKKTDKGTTAVIMDTAQKYKKPRASLIVLEIAKKVNDIVNKLFHSGNIDTMTNKWLKISLKKPRIEESMRGLCVQWHVF